MIVSATVTMAEVLHPTSMLQLVLQCWLERFLSTSLPTRAKLNILKNKNKTHLSNDEMLNQPLPVNVKLSKNLIYKFEQQKMCFLCMIRTVWNQTIFALCAVVSVLLHHALAHVSVWNGSWNVRQVIHSSNQLFSYSAVSFLWEHLSTLMFTLWTVHLLPLSCIEAELV